MRIQSTKEVSQGPVKMLVFGASGMGKTSLAKTMPKPLVISAERGLLSLGGTEIDFIDISVDLVKGQDGKEHEVSVPLYERPAKLREVFEYLQTEDARKKYQSVMLDSLTEMAQGVRAQCEVSGKKGWEMWGLYSATMINLIKAFRDLPFYHVVFTCLEEEDKDENGKRFYSPAMPGTAAKEFLVPAFDEVFRYYIVNGKRALGTEVQEAYKAKDRSGKLLPIESPDIGAVIRKIRGEE